MIVSDEPGYYEAGNFGVRIEDLVIILLKDGYRYFENVTQCPYDRNLIEPSLLT